MWGITADDDAVINQRRIRHRAEEKHGGTTTSGKVLNDVKQLAQKFGIADLIKIEPTKSKGWKLILMDPNRIHGRLSIGDRYGDFIDQFNTTINDCGYDIVIGDDYFDIFPV